MHDPSTLVHEISIPLPWREKNPFYKDGRKDWAKYRLLDIWHKDPERDGSDDSCGWFMRARHGNKKVLDKIVKRFEQDWDRVYQPSQEDHDPDDGAFVPKTYYCGLFKTDGHPNLSVQGIVLNLFFCAAIEHFDSNGLTNWRKAKRFLRRNLLDILLFAENPSDSLFDGITRKFQDGCGEIQTAHSRAERIRNLAGCIYAWILRAERPWYRHPKWHIHHWEFQLHPWQKFYRWAFERCAKCGGRFKWGTGSVVGDWSGRRIWHDGCDDSKKPSPDGI